MNHHRSATQESRGVKIMDSPGHRSAQRSVVAALPGCLYAVAVVAISAGLLFINALFAVVLVAVMPKPRSPELEARIAQFVYFVVPLLLLVLEWHAWDRVRRILFENRQVD